MTLSELIQEKGLSRYRLSKISGIPWATLSDICSGKAKFERCSVATLSKLSKALEISMEELLLLETGNGMDEEGKLKAYGGANGNKIQIRHQGKGYMLKFPPVPGRREKADRICTAEKHLH